jgi:sugar-specific transcriptional regulator TrmB
MVLIACLGMADFVHGIEVTPAGDSAFDVAAKALDRSKEEVQKLKDAWDKSRLETTLYDQRAKRAYKRCTKATTKARDEAKSAKERAELELQLAIEKRKLAYNQWQAALLRQVARESELKALDQDKDTAAVREKIKQLEGKIGPKATTTQVP